MYLICRTNSIDNLFFDKFTFTTILQSREFTKSISDNGISFFEPWKRNIEGESCRWLSIDRELDRRLELVHIDKVLV